MEHRRIAYFLPNLFTALNMACGFAAIMLAMNAQFYNAVMFLMLGAFFDLVDGRVARLTGTQSSFGEQFDSLSDLISFGLAPSLIFYLRFLTQTGRVGMVVAFLFVLCGALRLARFNANIDKISSNYFQGLPIPGASTALVGFILLSLEFERLFPFEYLDYVAIIYLSFYSLLMISSIPFPSFKNSPWVKKHKKKALLMTFGVVGLLVIYEELMIPVLITSYVILSVGYYALNHKKFVGIFSPSTTQENEDIELPYEDETANEHAH
ncbi:MAG: CDP-diacylglycerol--serine O-phosphatidyltransferase [Bacteriovoracaceae bacterium]|nr:CDP-diacylglycerol--serine O-phosphatidyltransferase [Bacteriovoracaceae bacterium]